MSGRGRFPAKKITVEVIPLDAKDFETSDKTVEAVLDYVDIVSDEVNTSATEDGIYVANVQIANRGFKAVDSIKVLLKKDSLDGETVATKTISSSQKFTQRQ